MQHLQQFLAALIQSVAQTAPYVVFGYLVAAAIREWIPIATLARLFKRDGLRPLLAASGIGALLPMCSCTVIPVGVGLVRGGAVPGTVLSFLFTSPALSPVAVILALSLLGPRFTAVYVGVCLVGAFLLGLIGNRLIRAAPVSPAEACAIPAAVDRRPLATRARAAARWAFWDLGADVSPDLLLGLTLAAAVLALVPMEWVGSWLGQQRFATLIYVILIGIPVYTCSVPSLPVVQSLLLAGMSPGAGIAYLIAGPATNLGELLVLRRNLGGRAAAIFAGGLALTALAGGLIADHIVFRGYDFHPTAAAGQVVNGCCVSSFMPVSQRPGVGDALVLIPAWHWPFIAVLVVTMSVGLARRVAQRFRPTGAEPVLTPELPSAVPASSV